MKFGDMKFRNAAISILFGAALSVPAGFALADGDGPPAAYGEARPSEAVLDSIDTMIAWAQAELDEHVGEGLYKDHAEDRALVEAMLERARQLRKSGDAVKGTEALSYYFAAEATARYAARMPHLLEDRLEEQAEHKGGQHRH